MTEERNEEGPPDQPPEAGAAEAELSATRTEGSARVAEIHSEVAETDARRTEEAAETAREEGEKLSRKERKQRKKAEQAAKVAEGARAEAEEAARVVLEKAGPAGRGADAAREPVSAATLTSPGVGSQTAPRALAAASVESTAARPAPPPLPGGGEAPPLAERPEVVIGAAFAGAFLFARVLRAITSHDD